MHIKKVILDDVIVILLLVQGFLGTTNLNNLQIILELILIILLFTNVQNIFVKRNFILFSVFIISSIFSFIINPIDGFMLNVKIFIICIMSLFYFENKMHSHFIYVEYFIMLNVLYMFAFKYLEVRSIEYLNIYTTNYDRAQGLFGSPHNAAYVLGIYTIYLFLKKKWFRFIFIFNGLLYTSSYTAILAFFGQIVFYIVNTIKKINPIIFLAISLGILYLLKGIILEDCQIWALDELEHGETVYDDNCTYKNHIPRWYSLEVMLPMIFDYRYWMDIFNLYPQPYSTYVIDNYPNRWANEIGLIKVFIEGGFILSLLLLGRFYKIFRIIIVFLFLSSLHYMFIVNIPFSLYLALQCVNRINIHKYRRN